ncbi:MAG TPA: 50S ribosomal protein L24 [Bacteroidia bacterium]|jgi:large subunit ribosomal protein L24|nr:50S ribosomal protein L24 [Bacteroidia bacterium]
MAKLKIKKGDTVKVIAGDDKNKQGRVLSVDKVSFRVLVEGINMATKHTRPNAKNTKGGIIHQEAPIHISNLMLVDAKGNATKVGRKVDDASGKLVRYSKKSGEVIK